MVAMSSWRSDLHPRSVNDLLGNHFQEDRIFLRTQKSQNVFQNNRTMDSIIKGGERRRTHPKCPAILSRPKAVPHTIWHLRTTEHGFCLGNDLSFERIRPPKSAAMQRCCFTMMWVHTQS